MPSAIEWMSIRSRADKGFLQYPRLVANLIGRNVAASDLAGICKGASLRWAESYCHTGSDIAFWKKYEENLANLKELAEAQRQPAVARGVKFVRTNDRCVNASSKMADLWTGGGSHGLKGYTIVPNKGVMHSVVAVGSHNHQGALFDPNIGQFNIPSTHFNSMYDVWSALWNFYKINHVLVYDIHENKTSGKDIDEDWQMIDVDPMDEWVVVDKQPPGSTGHFDLC